MHISSKHEFCIKNLSKSQIRFATLSRYFHGLFFIDSLGHASIKFNSEAIVGNMFFIISTNDSLKVNIEIFVVE